MKFTIKKFREQYPDDDTCLDAIFKLRYAKIPCCPQCSQETTFKRIPGRRCYQCSDKDCQYQLYPTAGTVFEKTRTPLTLWFYVIYLMVSTRNGLASKEVERQLGVTYKCALRMTHRIRLLMAADNELFKGIVEIDETYMGGKNKNKSNKKRKQIEDAGEKFGNFNKTAVFSILERSGKIMTTILGTSKPSANDLLEIIKNTVSEETKIMTDSSTLYAGLKNHYQHEAVNHDKKEFLRDGYIHTNTIEGFFSQVKRMIGGTHIKVSVKHMQKYLDECAFRYVHREQGQQMFFSILDKIAA